MNDISKMEFNNKFKPHGKKLVVDLYGRICYICVCSISFIQECLIQKSIGNK